MFSVQTDKGRSIKAEADLGSCEWGRGGGGMHVGPKSS